MLSMKLLILEGKTHMHVCERTNYKFEVRNKIWTECNNILSMIRIADEQIIKIIGEQGIGEYGIGEHGIGEHGIGEHGIGEYGIGEYGIGEYGKAEH